MSEDFFRLIEWSLSPVLNNFVFIFVQFYYNYAEQFYNNLQPVDGATDKISTDFSTESLQVLCSSMSHEPCVNNLFLHLTVTIQLRQWISQGSYFWQSFVQDCLSPINDKNIKKTFWNFQPENCSCQFRLRNLLIIEFQKFLHSSLLEDFQLQLMWRN